MRDTCNFFQKRNWYSERLSNLFNYTTTKWIQGLNSRLTPKPSLFHYKVAPVGNMGFETHTCPWTQARNSFLTRAAPHPPASLCASYHSGLWLPTSDSSTTVSFSATYVPGLCLNFLIIKWRNNSTKNSINNRLGRIKNWMQVQCSQQCLVHSNCWINVSVIIHSPHGAEKAV